MMWDSYFGHFKRRKKHVYADADECVLFTDTFFLLMVGFIIILVALFFTVMLYMI